VRKPATAIQSNRRRNEAPLATLGGGLDVTGKGAGSGAGVKRPWSGRPSREELTGIATPPRRTSPPRRALRT
jgi:hypothetical protein